MSDNYDVDDASLDKHTEIAYEAYHARRYQDCHTPHLPHWVELRDPYERNWWRAAVKVLLDTVAAGHTDEGDHA